MRTEISCQKSNKVNVHESIGYWVRWLYRSGLGANAPRTRVRCSRYGLRLLSPRRVALNNSGACRCGGRQDNVTAKDVEGFDAVVHLAELSNDPLGEHREAITYDINHRGSVVLATACKEAGVPRFVYTSSCSVYGAAADGKERDENSETNALTAYAKCKLLVERDVAAMAGPHFSPVFLRNATAFGASPRMRFDIVLNNLSGFAWTTNEIKMTSDGTPWRPLVMSQTYVKLS